MKILGIDPGTTRVGYGLIDVSGSKFVHVSSGLLSIPNKDLPQRLVAIEKGLSQLIKRGRPVKIGVETLFFSKNKKTALEVAEARGVIIATATKQAIPIVEVSPQEVKLSVTGSGAATKDAVAKMVEQFLGIATSDLVDDVTDALAVAIAVSSLRG